MTACRPTLALGALAMLLLAGPALAQHHGGHRHGQAAPATPYADVAGFCKSATLEDIRAHGHVLTPGRYVGAEEVADDGEPFADKMTRLSAELSTQFAQSAALEAKIKAHLRELGFDNEPV